MLFFKSEYYTPLYSDLIEGQKVTERVILKDISFINHSTNKTKTSVADLLARFCVRHTYTPTLSIDVQAVLSQSVMVTDLSGGLYSTPDLNAQAASGFESIGIVNVYFYPKAEVFFIHRTHYNNPLAPMFLKDIMIPHLHPQQWTHEMLVEAGMIVSIKETKKHSSIGVLVQDGNGLSLVNRTLKNTSIDFDTMYNKDFKAVSDNIVKVTSDEDNTGLIILHGDPGTGKTSYIRWLSYHATRHFVYVPAELVRTLTGPVMVNFLLKHPGLTFVIEDAEATLTPRHGSESSIVSTILNLTDGLLGDVLKCQFICTFNTPLSNVDLALLRPGRLLVRHQFDLLSTVESNRYLESVGVTKRVTEPSSLATLMNLETLPTITVVDKPATFGFNHK